MTTSDSTSAENAIADLDPQLRQFATVALDLMKLQTLQTVAAHKDPSNFHLKPRQIRVQNSNREYNNVSLAVDKLLKAMPAEKRAKLLAGFNLGAHLTPELKMAMQQTKVDLKSPKPVLEQVDLKSRFSFVDPAMIQKAAASRTFDEATGGSVHTGGEAGQRTGAVRPSTMLKFRLHELLCVDETTAAEWKGTDDMYVAGTATDDKNNTTAIAEFLVGEFNDGGKKVYSPPKVLKTFSLSGEYPKTFMCILSIAESDAGKGFGTFIVDLVNAVDDEVEAIMIAAGLAASVAIGGVVGGPIGMLIGAVGVFLVSQLVGFINKIAASEIFQPKSAVLQLDSAGHRFANETTTSAIKTFNFKEYSGEYKLSYSWDLD